jgi:hypothetical protein
MHPLRGTDIYSGPWRRLPPYSECREESAPASFALDPGGPVRGLMKTTVAPIDLSKVAMLPIATNCVSKWPSWVETRLLFAFQDVLFCAVMT